MSLRRVLTVVGLLALTLPAWASAQGIGDTAARERKKREKAPKAAEKAKEFTNDDLAKGRPAEQKTDDSGSTTTSSPTAPDRVTSSENENGGESESPSSPTERIRPYMDALTNAQSRVTTIENQIKQLQDKLNPMSGSFIYGAGGSNNPTEEAQVREQLSQAEAQLGQARQELAAASEAVRDIRLHPPAPE
jgi:chemotaxis protein histidine kinase CheA